MTANEFREILDRFHVEMARASQWATDQLYSDPASAPEWIEKLDQVWRDLNGECSRMKDAERRMPCGCPLGFHPPM